MKVIEQSHIIETKSQDTFLYGASKGLCVKDHRLIKKNYMNALLVFHKVLVDQSIIVSDMCNIQSSCFRHKK